MISFRKLQAKVLYDPQVVAAILNDPLGVMGSMTKLELAILNYLLYWSNHGGDISAAQETMAKFVGCTRRYVNKVIDKFIGLGLVASQERKWYTCLYKVSSYFNDFKVRSLLKGFLSQLAFLPISLFNLEFSPYSSINLLIAVASSSSSSKAVTCVYAREERVMEVKEYVETIGNPVMTAEEKVSLSQYSKEAVADALRALQRKQAEGNIENPVRFLIGCARAYDPKRAYSKTAAAEKGSASPARQQWEAKDVKDAAFWKKDKEKMAHWDILELGVHLSKCPDKDLANQLTAVYREALGLHAPADCHLCIEHGTNYKQPLRTFVAGDPQREAVQKRSLAYKASLRGESESYCLALQHDTRTAKELELMDSDRAHEQHLAKKAVQQESIKDRGGISHQVDMQSSSALLDPSFMPTTPSERMAQVAARQLQASAHKGGMRQISEVMAHLPGSSIKEVEVVRMAPAQTREHPQIQTTVNGEEPEPSGWYDESQYDEIFTLS